jgi:hypothetical protein
MYMYKHKVNKYLCPHRQLKIFCLIFSLVVKIVCSLRGKNTKAIIARNWIGEED